MYTYLGFNSYKKKTFSSSEDDTYYDFKVKNVVFPSDYNTHENLNGECITYRIEDLNSNE